MAEAEMDGVDLGGSSGPDVDLDGLSSVRPMEEPRRAPDTFWARATEGWASPNALGFKQGRRKAAKPIEKPPYNFIEMFYKHIETEKGMKTLSFGERWERCVKMGQWVGDSAVNKIFDGAGKLWPSRKYGPDEVEILDDGKDPFDNEKAQKDFEDEFAKENAKAEAREAREEEARAFRMEQDGPETSPGGATRVTINPADTSHQVGSERVGPDRQIRQTTDPWPLDRPRADEAPERRALPQPARQISDHRDDSEKGGSKGEAAAERGRAAAQGLIERKGAPKALPKPKRSRDAGDMEM